MSMRRHFSPEQKATIVWRHLGGKEPVSNLAEDVGVQSSQIHLWVKQLLDQAERAFPSSGRKRATASPDQIRRALQPSAVE